MASWISGWWNRPREQTLRRALFQLHLWTGVAIGLYLSAIGLTGALLIFEDDLEELFHPSNFHVTGPLLPAAPVSALLQGAQMAFPERQATAIYAPTAARQTYVVYLRRGDEVLHAFLHPVTGEITGTTLPSTSFVRWIQDFHFNLLNGRGGRSVNGIGGLLLFFLCVSGLVLWWPGVRSWKAAVRVHPDRGWKRTNWELHTAVGFWTFLFLSMWALTGFYFGYAAQVSAFLHRVSPLSQVEAPSSRPTGAPRFEAVDQFVAEARERAPRGHFFGLQMPLNPRGTYIVFMSRETPAEKRHCDYLYFDQYSGSYNKTWRRGVSLSWGDAIVNSVVPLHFGTFGGTPVRILWFLAGISLPLLFGTGAVMWWNRSLSKR